MIPVITTQQIQIFLAVADAGSFAKGAEKLFMTQSAVSKAVFRLEQQLGFPLIARTTHSFYLTENGKLLYDLCSSHMQELDQSLAEIHAQKLARDKMVRIATINSIRVDSFLSAILSRFESAFPECSFQLESESVMEIVEQFLHREFDMIFVPDFLHYSLEENGLPWKWAARDFAQAIVPKDSPLAERDSLSLSELINERFASLDEAVNQDYFRDLSEKFASLGAKLQVGKKFKTASAVRSFHRAKDGLLFVDNYFDYEPMARAVKIPVTDCMNGIICSWQKDKGKNQKLLEDLAALV